MWLEIILLFSLAAMAWDILSISKLQKQLGTIPIVSKIPIFGSCFMMASFRPENLHLKFREFIERFGKTMAGRIFGTTVIITADAVIIGQLMSSQQHVRKSMLYNLLKSWLGNGLLLSYGPKWLAMRKIITPTFHFKILEKFVEVFDSQSTILIDKLQQFADGETVVNIFPYVGLTTLDIIAETAMGVRVNAQADANTDFVQSVNDVTEAVATRFMNPHLIIPWMFKLLKPKLYEKQKSGTILLHRFTKDIIQQRRAKLQRNKQSDSFTTQNEDYGLKPRMALLDVLLQSSIDNVPLTDEQIRDEVNTFMFEGHDTTTSATAFCLYLLSRNPQCQQKLFQELRAHFGDDLTQPITYNDLLNLNYLNCVVKESLRLYPPIPAIGRWLKDDWKLDNAILPAGTNIIVLLWELLRDPELFPEPMLFLPERHLEHHSYSNVFSNIPFSAGPRNCIGQRFALFEMKTIVVKIVRHYILLANGEEVHPSIKIVLKSKTGVNLSIKPRTD